MSGLVRICIVGEWLHGPPDEGIHNLAQNLADQWKKENLVWTIKVGADLMVNRLFLNLNLRKILQSIHPDLVFYISPSCAKTAALLRAKILKVYCPQAKVLVIASQPAVYKPIENRLLPFLSPDGIYVQSAHSKGELEALRCPVYFLPSGVDTQRFVPVDVNRKMALRQLYGVDEKALVILHVGHISPTRNIHLLSNVARLRDGQVLLVGSTSTPQDETISIQLKRLNVRIIRKFMPHIEELYQLSDIYFFPVISEHASIGVPLSVLEAMACNLRVITTRFGGLPQMFEEGQGFLYFEDESELPKLVEDAKLISQCVTRQMVGRYTWNIVAHRALEMALSMESSIWN